MTVTITEQSVKGVDGGEVTVRRDGAFVVVRWLCGDTRSFKPAYLRDVLSRVQHVEGFPDVWMETEDSQGSRFAIRIDGKGNLYADTGSRDADPDEDQRRVPWKSLRKALQRAMKE